jgi:hypothetical protein
MSDAGELEFHSRCSPAGITDPGYNAQRKSLDLFER